MIRKAKRSMLRELLTLIYLLPSFQKRGIGKELFITSMRQLISFGYESQVL